MTAPRRDSDEPIDWTAARGRLAEAAAATNKAARPSRKQAARILADRARALAEPRAEPRSAASTLQLITFTRGGERFGLETRYVRAVGREPSITPIPLAADFVLGVTSFHGEIVAVFDIQAFIQGRQRRPTERTQVLFLGTDEIEFAIVADTLDEVMLAPADEISPRPWRPDDAASEVVNGLTPGAVNVLDGAALLNDERLFVDQARAGSATGGGN